MRPPGRGPVALAAATAGAAVLATSSATWFTARAPSVLTGSVRVEATGADAAPGLTGLALVLLAAGAAIALGRTWAARVAGAAVALAGLAVVVVTVGVLEAPEPALEAAAADASGVRLLDGRPDRTAWPGLTAVLGGLAVLAGTTAVLAAPGWRSTGRRFEAGSPPTTAAADERTRAMDDWDALGRGDDPSGPR